MIQELGQAAVDGRQDANDRIPLLDLGAQHRAIGAAVEHAALRVLRSGRYVLGPEVAAFEDEFARYTASKHAVGVNTGTSAIHLALLALGVGQGDEVITVPFTFVATVAAVLYCGARPVLVDVTPHTLTMDPDLLDKAITPRTRAIVPVHLYGHPAAMDPILEVAARHGVPVVEDAAQAHGATYKGRPAGSMGVAGCFSFYPGKNLGAAGEGGAIVTTDDGVAARARLLRDWGARHKYDHQLVGFNYRLDELQAAVLRVKLGHLEEWTEARRVHARAYRDELEGVEGAPVPVGEEAHSRHVYHVFAVRSPRRDALRLALGEQGVDTGVHYPTPVHLQPGYAHLGYRRGDFPVSERAATEVLSLPIFPELTGEQRCRVLQALRRCEEEFILRT
jgi:dTDP-4-amino-4,6-dideoxygalactose transaminase